MDTNNEQHNSWREDLKEVQDLARTMIQIGDSEQKMKAAYSLMTIDMGLKVSEMIEELSDFKDLIVKMKTAPVEYDLFVGVKDALFGVLTAIINSVSVDQ